MRASKGEIKIEEILKRAGLDFKMEYTFPDLTSPNGRLLRFDFVIFDDDGYIDFIIEYQNQLFKIQCKTSHLFGDNDDGIVFACRSTINSKERRYSKDEIDYFCTFYNNVCYLIPVEECSVEKKLRFIPPKNN